MQDVTRGSISWKTWWNTKSGFCTVFPLKYCSTFDIWASHLFLCGLRVENLVHFKDAALSFVQHAEAGLVVGVRCHHHGLALFVLVLLQHRLHTAQHADVAWTQKEVDEPDFTFCCETLFLRLPFSSTSCSWYFLRSATSFLYFSRRSLLASDISLMAAEICQTKKTETKLWIPMINSA